ncbi:MAG: hypothetical protein JJV98_03370, partial [Desulfosarcina sp.]|nr:hypothetical protein [Desulfobacterales bacterium]
MLQLTSQKLSRIKAETLIVPVCEDQILFHDKAMRKLAESVRTIKTFTARPGEYLSRYQPDGIGVERVIFAGLGLSRDLTRERLRQAAGQSIRRAWHAQAGNAVVAVPDAHLPEPTDFSQVFEALTEGAYLANHTFPANKLEHRSVPVKHIWLVV